MVELSSLGILQISGNDAARFLQGQTTCDVLQLPELQLALGAFCNPQGRIIANFRIFKWQNNFYLLLACELVLPLIEQIKKYAVFFKCTLENITDDWKIYGIFGENIPEFTETTSNILLKLSSQQSRFILLHKKSSPKSSNLLAFTPIDETTWKLADINDSFALIHTETSSLFTPHEINLPQLGGVSFNKGCYTGQEIVARMHYLGKLKQQLQHIKISTTQNILLGSDLLADNHMVGQLVDGTVINNYYEGLAVIRNDALERKITLLDQEVVVL